jgi:CRISPR-associated endoribonuclease Cas6
MMEEQGELFSLLLRLHPREPGQVTPGAGNQIQAAFLDLIRQGDPALAEWLHTPNQRRPYALGLLQGFNHMTPAQLEEARIQQRLVAVQPGQIYWLRISLLDATLFRAFTHCLITQSRDLTLRIGEARFEITRLLSTPEAESTAQPWVGYSSFADLHQLQAAQKHYEFEFVTPTAFSMGQRTWGKMLKVFPEPALVFESLARQWNLFAPAPLHMEQHDLTPRRFAAWCEEQIIVNRYALETCYLPSSKFGQTGFQGKISYEVKGNPSVAEARRLTSLARFAFFSGVGYKTTMGMGQARCTNLPLPATEQSDAEEQAE